MILIVTVNRRYITGCICCMTLIVTVNRRYITGCICCMTLIVTVNTIAECPRTDCNMYWEGEKMELQCSSPCTQQSATCPYRQTVNPVHDLLPYFFQPNLMHFPLLRSFKIISSRIRNTFRNTLSLYGENLLATRANIHCRTTPLRPSATTYSVNSQPASYLDAVSFSAA